MPEYITQLKANGTSRYIVGRAKNATCYDTIAAVVADASHISAGQYLQTSGYYTANDGGGGLYRVQTAIDTNYRQESIKSGFYATLIPIDGTINVKQCGAKGDGTTNDTAAIQAALNVSSANTIVFPPGTYICNGAKIPSNKHIIGHGASIKVTETYVNGAIVDNVQNHNIGFMNVSDWTSGDNPGDGTGGYGQARNIIVEGLDFFSIMTNQCGCLAFGHAEHIKILNCSFHDIKEWHFIEINSCRDTVIDGCTFYNYGSSDGSPTEMIQLDFMKSETSNDFPWFGPYDNTINCDIRIINCEFQGDQDYSRTSYMPAAIGNHTGADIAHRISNVSILNNTFKYLGAAIKFIVVHSCVISGNIVDTCKNGFIFVGDTGSYCEVVVIENNYLWGAGLVQTSASEITSRGIASFNPLNNKKYFFVRNNYIASFYGHLLTVQTLFGSVNGNTCTGSKVGHGIYIGYDERGGKYFGNDTYGNKLADLYVNANSETSYISAEGSLGDIVVAENKATTSEFTTTSTTAAPIIIRDNNLKNAPTFGTFGSDTNLVIRYENNTISTTYSDYLSSVYKEVAPTVSALTENTWTALASFALKPGFYIVLGQVGFGTGGFTGTLGIGTAANRRLFRNTYNISGGKTYNAQVMATLYLKEPTTIYFDIYPEQGFTPTSSVTKLCAMSR